MSFTVVILEQGFKTTSDIVSVAIGGASVTKHRIFVPKSSKPIYLGASFVDQRHQNDHSDYFVPNEYRMLTIVAVENGQLLATAGGRKRDIWLKLESYQLNQVEGTSIDLFVVDC